jgi:hypothetical protein
VGRDIWRRKLERHLSRSIDEPIFALISAVVALQGGNLDPQEMVPDFPPDGIGAELGSEFHIPLWTLETLINELLATEKEKYLGNGKTRILRSDRYQVLQTLRHMIIKLENAEDGIFLEKHDVFTEMNRIAQRQFPWQRGFVNAPVLYRSLFIYGSGSAAKFFEESNGLTVSDFVKIGCWLTGALQRSEYLNRQTDLTSIGISATQREAALKKFSIEHSKARSTAHQMRLGNLHTAYKPSILRDFPVIAFGEQNERLRAPIPYLITQRWTSGIYLDVVKGGSKVWEEIGDRFEQYCLDYLGAMMAPYGVCNEQVYGSKKARYRSPDVLVSNTKEIVLVAECKAKRMSFEARFADDPVAEAALGYDEIAKGIFQLWRFFSHARRGLFASAAVSPDCQGIVLTADTWLTMARNQSDQVYANAHKLADQEGGIIDEDRRYIAVCVIDDIEFVLQNSSPDKFLEVIRTVSSEEKRGWILSISHALKQTESRPFPFTSKISEFLPWWKEPDL